MLEDEGQGARLLVQEQAQYVDGVKKQVVPKYESTGSIILPVFLAELLREVLESHESEWVFPSKTGRKMDTGAYFYADIWRRFVDGNEAVPDRFGRPPRLPAMKAVAAIR